MPGVSRGRVDEILIIDGGSTGDIPEYAREQGYWLLQRVSRGARTARSSSTSKGDVIVSFSPDGNSIPEPIRDFRHKRGGGVRH